MNDDDEDDWCILKNSFTAQQVVEIVAMGMVWWYIHHSRPLEWRLYLGKKVSIPKRYVWA